MAGRPGCFSQLPSSIAAQSASVYSHRPSLVIPTVVTALRVRSIWESTEAADRSDTSCSGETPPNKTNTFLIKKPSDSG